MNIETVRATASWVQTIRGGRGGTEADGRSPEEATDGRAGDADESPQEAGENPQRTRDDSTATTDIPLDVVYQILANERRRRICRYIYEESPTPTVGELAEHIASVENEITVSNLSSKQRKRVYIALYQNHLPRLDDADVIQFDEDRKSIGPGINLGTTYDILVAVEHAYGRPEDTDQDAENGVTTTVREFIAALGQSDT